MGVHVSHSVTYRRAGELRPVETGSHKSTNGECPAVIFVRVHNHSNKHCLF